MNIDFLLDIWIESMIKISLFDEVMDETQQENVEEIHISWYGCRGIKLTDFEVKEVESLCDDILNIECYFDDSDAWVTEFFSGENIA